MTNENLGRKANDIICTTLMEEAADNQNLVVLTSDSRGSASIKPFIDKYSDQSIEMGIAEQNLVTVGAGLAHAGKRPFVMSPAAFLTMRSIEQVKVDVAYSDTNVKLIGISGGNSYSDLGSTHHSVQDLAVTQAIPNLEIYMPCDQYQTKALFKYLAHSNKPAYVRVGKMTLPDCYDGPIAEFKPGKANILRDGKDICLMGAGETVYQALEAAESLASNGVSACVVDLVSIKPIDQQLIEEIGDKFAHVITVEEHAHYGGLGATVAQILSCANTNVYNISFPDEPVISGNQLDVFEYYGMDVTGIVKKVKEVLEAN